MRRRSRSRQFTTKLDKRPQMNSATQPAFEGPPEITEKARRNPYVAFALRAGLGVAVVVILLWHYDARPIFRLLRRESPAYFVATIVIFIAGQAMSAYRWQLLARLNHISGPYREYLSYYFIGMFTNLFVPGLIGGDAARAAYLGFRNRRMGEAVASVVADRGVGLIALFWFAAVAALTVSSVRLPPTMIEVTVAIGALALVGYLAAPLLIRPVSRLRGRFGRFARPLIPYCQNPQRLLAPLALS